MELAQLAVFVRAPIAGSVKTRLHSRLGPEGATELYCAFVDDVVELCNRVQEAGRVGVALWADDADDPAVRRWAEALGTSPKQQADGDLGRRMTVAFEEGLAKVDRVVIIGSDAPTLPFGSIVSAFDRLADVPLVLGPSNDGGYYIIGASKAPPRFDGVRWSTEFAYQDTRVANSAVTLGTVPPWYDVDDEADLDALRAHLSVSPDAASATATVLHRLRRATHR
jgi:rSAM/selenodomain-associated transferase 1